MRTTIGLALGLAACGHAIAQETPATDRRATDLVIVTGLGPERTGDELITNTTALGSAEIARRIDGGLGDTLAGLPGVSSTSFGPGASRPVIRGLGAERVQVLTNGIGVIDASAASPDHAVTTDPLGAERIEILRGPAVLAYGGGASGGVVNVIDGLIVESKQARSASAKVYGGYTSVDEGAAFSGRATLGAGPIVGVLAASSRDTSDIEIPGFAESEALRALEAEEGEGHEEEESEGVLPNSWTQATTYAGGLSLVGEGGFVGVALRQLDTSYGIVGGHGHEEEEGGEESEEEGGGPFIELEQQRLDIRGGARIDFGPFDSFTSAISGVEYEHTEFEAPGEAGTVFTSNGVEGRAELDHGSIGGWVGTFGAQGLRRKLEAVGEEAFLSPTTTRQAGVFLFETYERDGWGVEGGARFDRTELDNDINGERSFDTVNLSLGVHGHVLEDLFLGASVSRTERAPNDVELFADGPHIATRQFEVGDPELDTEEGVNVELTARWTVGPFELGGSIYRFDFDRFIFLSPTGEEEDGLPVFVTLQEDASFTGGEVTAAFDIGRAAFADWRLDASFDVVRAELNDGEDLPRIPPMSASLGIEAEAGPVTGRLEARWADEQDKIAAFELPTDSWTTVDLRITTALSPDVDLIVEGTNLTDEEVRLHASPLKDFAPQPGRGIRIALRADF